MRIKKIIKGLSALSALIICLALSSIGQTRTDQPIQADLFGLHSLLAGQTALLSVVNRQRLSDQEIIPCIRVWVVMDIYEADPFEPTKLRPVRRVEHEAVLDPGEAASFSFAASRTGNFVSVSFFYFPINEPDPPEPFRGAVVATLQVQESGRTVLTLPGTIKSFDPQPDPPAVAPY